MSAYSNLDRMHVESSNLDWVSYDETTSDLYICFKSKSVYVYRDVPKKVYNELLSAESKGKYHNANIKWNYTYKRIN